MLTKRAKLVFSLLLAAVVTLGFIALGAYTPSARARREFTRACNAARNTNATAGPAQIDVTSVRLRMENYFCNMDTNALPIMLEWIDDAAAPPSGLRSKAPALGRLLRIRSTRFWQWLDNADADLRALAACDTFRFFKGRADWTVPRLQQLAKMNTAGAFWAKQSLVYLGQTDVDSPHTISQTNR